MAMKRQKLQDRFQDNSVKISFLSPVVVVPLDDDLIIFDPFDKLKSPVPTGFRPISSLYFSMAAGERMGRAREPSWPPKEHKVLGPQRNRIFIDDFYLLDWSKTQSWIPPGSIFVERMVFVDDAIERNLYRIGVKRCSIMEFSHLFST